MLIATLILASSVIGLANPYLLKLMIDDAFPKGDIGHLAQFAGLPTEISAAHERAVHRFGALP